MPRRSAAEPARGPGPEVDLAATLENAGRVADYAHHGRRLSDYVAGTGIELVEGTGPARFVDPYTVAVGDGRSWQADRIVVAVGGHPGRLPIAGAELALTYTDLRALAALPGRVAVIGGADFGCQTLLLEYAPRLIPRADQDLSAALGAAFTRRGIEVVTGASAERLVRVAGGVEVHYQQANGPARRLVDAVFFAVGWPANLEGLELAAAGVAAERGLIPVNDWLQTNVAHVFAAGDVNGRSMLVPSARHEGRLAAENAVLGTRRQVAHEIVPTGSFTRQSRIRPAGRPVSSGRGRRCGRTSRAASRRRARMGRRGRPPAPGAVAAVRSPRPAGSGPRTGR